VIICDHLERKKEVVSIPVPKLHFADQWRMRASPLQCCPSFHNGGTSVHYMYCLVSKHLRKINVMRILKNSSFCGSFLYCLKRRHLRNINVIRILQRASVYGYMTWVFLSNSAFTYSQIYLNSLHCILNCLQ
jgi:hypothetical protein